MNIAVNELVRSIIDKSSLDECSVDELQQLTQQYPYFGPAQFLLARKLKEEVSPLYDQQCQRAILYFQDNLWFDYLSGEGIFTGTVVKTETGTETGAVVTEEPVYEPMIQEEAVAEPEPVVQIEEPVVHEQTDIPAVHTETTYQEEETAAAPIITEEPVAEPEPVAHIQEPEVNEQTDISAVHTETNQPQEEIIITGTIVTEEPVSEPAPVLQEEEQPAVTEMNNTYPIHTATNEVREEMIAPLGPSEIIPDAGTETQTETETGTETEPGVERVVEPPPFKIEALDKSPIFPTFEPYHTIDYFASQGIRFREEEKPKDRFGQQLKSFTEWLKSMKRLPEPETVPVVADDKKVTQLAEHSIVNRDVVTEAMAEVWEKQGNAAKAIEIYSKLSLLNPAKSSYFAAKIEHLKNL